MTLKFKLIALLLLSATFLLADFTVTYAANHMKDIIAVTVRRHGYTCDIPKQAKRDQKRSTPGQMAWRLNCSNGNFFVKFSGNGRALVKLLKTGENKKSVE